jgi:cyclopropane fatty-acyl-phospholipid synthase-like methyltransferase
MQTKELSFFEQWNIYQNVIKHNYMYHNEILNEIKKEFSNRKKFSILDLGCGDSYMVKHALGEHQYINYLGIDTSSNALEFSKRNLHLNNVQASHINGDFLEELKKLENTFDVIISGYSLHHLSTKDKKKFFILISKRLSKGGVFIFYDIEAKDHDSLSEYKNRACTLYKREWTELSNHEIENIVMHVQNNDIAETESFFRQNMQESKLINVDKVFKDKEKLFSLYLAKRTFD